jgi:hypothetical protein
MQRDETSFGKDSYEESDCRAINQVSTNPESQA